MEGPQPLLQPAFILHHRKYRESSLILDCLTCDYGRISVLAKGVQRKNSRLAGILLPFTALRLSFSGRSDLKTLTHAEYQLRYPLTGLALYCGFYLNELLCQFLQPHDPYPALFSRYQNSLQALAEGRAIESTLRYFELDLLKNVGYGLQLPVFDTQQQNRLRYRFEPDAGLVPDEKGAISAQTLHQLKNRQLLSDVALSEAKILLRQIIDCHLQGKPLKSRTVLAQVLPYL